MFDAYILYHARQRPNQNAITTARGSLTFAELDGMVNRFARTLAAFKLQSDTVVAVDVEDLVTHWLFLLALSRIGIASACGTDLAASFRISDHSLAVGASNAFYASKTWIETASAGSPSPFLAVCPEPARLGRVLLSSGTTGVQKRIGLSWALIDANIRNAVLAYGPIPQGPVLLETGVHTAFGFNVTLASWAAGHAVHFRDRMSLTETLVRFPPGFLAMIPLQLQHTLERLPKRFKPLVKTRLVILGGVLPRSLARDARLRLAPDVYILYAASECSAVTFGDAAWLDEREGVAGYPLPGVEVEIVDNAGRPAEPGVQGLVRIRSDRVVGRYLEPEQKQAAFKDGFFYPGDLGRLMEDGLLLIEGRADDVMNLGGVKLLPQVVEDVLQGCPGIVDVAAFAVPDESGMHRCWLALVLEADFKYDEMIARLNQGLNFVSSFQVLKLDCLPRNEMGKIERKVLVAAAQRTVSELKGG